MSDALTLDPAIARDRMLAAAESALAHVHTTETEHLADNAACYVDVARRTAEHPAGGRWFLAQCFGDRASGARALLATVERDGLDDDTTALFGLIDALVAATAGRTGIARRKATSACALTEHPALHGLAEAIADDPYVAAGTCSGLEPRARLPRIWI